MSCSTCTREDKTLEDGEVNEAMDRILKALEGLGIELRK